MTVVTDGPHGPTVNVTPGQDPRNEKMDAAGAKARAAMAKAGGVAMIGVMAPVVAGAYILAGAGYLAGAGGKAFIAGWKKSPDIIK